MDGDDVVKYVESKTKVVVMDGDDNIGAVVRDGDGNIKAVVKESEDVVMDPIVMPADGVTIEDIVNKAAEYADWYIEGIIEDTKDDSEDVFNAEEDKNSVFVKEEVETGDIVTDVEVAMSVLGMFEDAAAFTEVVSCNGSTVEDIIEDEEVSGVCKMELVISNSAVEIIAAGFEVGDTFELADSDVVAKLESVDTMLTPVSDEVDIKGEDKGTVVNCVVSDTNVICGVADSVVIGVVSEDCSCIEEVVQVA